MAGNKKIFIDSNDFYSLDTDGVNTNVIYLNPFAYMATHDGTISGLQTLSIQDTVLEEIAVADLDVALNEGKYAVTSANSIALVVNKVAIEDEETAKNYIRGFLLVYQMKTMEYSGEDNIYTLESYTASGTFLGSTIAADIEDLKDKIILLDEFQNINSVNGYQFHILKRAIAVSA